MPDFKISVKMPDMRMFLSSNYVDAIAAAQRRFTGPDLKELFGQTVRGWKNKPDFRSQQTITSNSIAMRVYADGENADQYALVVKGSPPHTIRPKKGPFLRFQKGYTPSTYPRLLSSRAFSRSGAFVRAEAVAHPGFEPRAFDESIGESYQQQFEQDMQDAVKFVV